MDAILVFLGTHSQALLIAWWITLGLTLFLYASSYLVPGKIIGGILPFHTAFHLDKNLDLDFQTIGYATVHQHWFSRVTHYTIFYDAFLWFGVFHYWHWTVAAGVAVFCIAQALIFRERQYAVMQIGFVLAYFGGSWALGNAVGWEALYLVSIVVLMFGGFIRFVGHAVEPMPPGVLDRTDQFRILTAKSFRPKVIVMALIGYVAEFASGFPFRLFTVQTFILAQLLKWKPQSRISLPKARETAVNLTSEGFRAHPAFAELYESVKIDSQK